MEFKQPDIRKLTTKLVIVRFVPFFIYLKSRGDITCIYGITHTHDQCLFKNTIFFKFAFCNDRACPIFLFYFYLINLHIFCHVMLAVLVSYQLDSALSRTALSLAQYYSAHRRTLQFLVQCCLLPQDTADRLKYKYLFSNLNYIYRRKYVSLTSIVEKVFSIITNFYLVQSSGRICDAF